MYSGGEAFVRWTYCKYIRHCDLSFHSQCFLFSKQKFLTVMNFNFLESFFMVSAFCILFKKFFVLFQKLCFANYITDPLELIFCMV